MRRFGVRCGNGDVQSYHRASRNDREAGLSGVGPTWSGPLVTAAYLLKETLAEEKNADKLLSRLAEGKLNREAA
jgi:hypothetical protein